MEPARKLPKAGTKVIVHGGVLDGKQGVLRGPHRYTSMGWGERYYTDARVEFVADGVRDIVEIPVKRLELV